MAGIEVLRSSVDGNSRGDRPCDVGTLVSGVDQVKSFAKFVDVPLKCPPKGVLCPLHYRVLERSLSLFQCLASRV